MRPEILVFKMSTPSNSGKRRVWMPKKKTGCLTCKARKIKCDELRPVCRRCTSSGRECAGYRSSPTPPTEPSTVHAWLSSDREKQSFNFYLTYAQKHFSGFFNTVFWSREVLQAAVHNPPIRQLVVCLGAMYEHFQELSPGKDVHDDNSTQFALQQCNHAISHFAGLTSTSPQSYEDLCCIVTASILFAVFASLRTKFTEAISHVRSGLRVLHNVESSGISGAFPVSLARLRGILTAMYAQVRAMINDEAQEQWFGHDPLVSKVDTQMAFADIVEAEQSVQALYSNILAFFQRAEVHPPASLAQTQDLLQTKSLFTAALNHSRIALSELVDRGIEGTDERAIAVLRLYQTLLGVQLGVHEFDGKDNREILYDKAESQFVLMLGYCKQVLANNSDDPGMSITTFNSLTYSSGLGVVAPLHMIAARCRNPGIRYEAVRLLRSARRREWLWDSERVANTVSKTIEFEELAAQSHPSRLVPETFRIREVKVKFDDEGIPSHAEYISVEQSRRQLSGSRPDLSA